MKFTLTVEMDNAAFSDSPLSGYNPAFSASELARILRSLAAQIEGTGELEHTVRDINGNTVGKTKVQDA